MALRHRPAIVLAIILGVPSAALACLWDYDTLQQERARFPAALELITGKFLRHSPEFYEWRIRDRLKKLETDPTNLAWHDDLAVAYEKTGRHAKAIETILANWKPISRQNSPRPRHGTPILRPKRRAGFGTAKTPTRNSIAFIPKSRRSPAA